jgi:hypothetical protein
LVCAGFVGGTLWGLKYSHRSRAEIADARRQALKEELIALRIEEKALDEWERQKKADEDALAGRKPSR